MKYARLSIRNGYGGDVDATRTADEWSLYIQKSKETEWTVPERKLILPPSLNKLMRKSFLPPFISVNDPLLQSFHWNLPSDGVKHDLVHLGFGTAHISAFLSLPSLFSTVLMIFSFFYSPVSPTVTTSCFLNDASPYFITSTQKCLLSFLHISCFYCLICANMYCLLKKFLSKWLIKQPPPNTPEDEALSACYKIDWK